VSGGYSPHSSKKERKIMEKLCQSCGMPMADEALFGTNADGSKNEEYCKYCFENGSFGKDETLEEMIATCIPFMVEEGMKEEEAKGILESTLPQLKRWQKQA
jgi:hypothetical protein